MTAKRMRFLQQLLKFVGLDGRLHLEWISSAEAQKFVRVVTEFTERIKALGPNPLAGFNEKIEALGPRAVAGPARRDVPAPELPPAAAKREAKMA
jgi:F420-non-reducing hydrogenase iron-sulfur subunit